MGGLRGRPINAVLIPPQVRRFEALTGVDASTLDVNVTGWSKRVVLGDDRVFLFPRESAKLDAFERELTAYEALAHADLDGVPRLLERWDDTDVYPFPFAAVSRLRGATPEDAAPLFGQLGDAVARWHALPPPQIPGSAPPEHHARKDMAWMRRALEPATTEEAVEEAADMLAADGRPWRPLMQRASAMEHVLVHGDIHEDQLLAEDGRLTGVIDWETVRIDHPFWDFDLGEWGTGFWRLHRPQFDELLSTEWRAYAQRRGDVDPDPAPLLTVYKIRQSIWEQLGGPA